MAEAPLVTPQSSKQLCKGTLLVARPAASGVGGVGSLRGGRGGNAVGGGGGGGGGSAAGAEEWQPFRFTHHHGGAITLRALTSPQSKGGGRDGAGTGGSCLFDRASPTGASVPTPAKEGVDYLLDADWQKPFVACPWRPLPRRSSSASGSLGLAGAEAGFTGEAVEVAAAAAAAAASVGGRGASQLLPGRGGPGGGLGGGGGGGGGGEQAAGDHIYPFTLSYAPLPSVPGEPEPTAPQRRTVVLAATDVAARDRWLTTLSQKARSPDLRRTAVSLPVFPGAAALAAAAQRGRLAGLGERHSGLPSLPATPADANPRRRRLPAGHRGLWDASSKFHVVRELYDGYASDPLGEVERGGKRAAASPQAASSRRLLERYIERQAKIESLLGEKIGTGRLELHPPTPHTAASSDVQSVEAFEMPTPPVAPVPEQVEVPPLADEVEVLALTPNASLEGRVLANDEWSGGALFRPPSTRSFRLTVRPEEPMDMNPVFIGIAPADADLSIVNFFDVGSGVFLCMGGIASEALIAALGAPGGPFFHCFGERAVADLPVAPRGACLSVQYTEESPPGGGPPEGQVVFLVHDVDGDGVYYARPPLTHRLAPGIWRPCVLLCMPNTHVHVERLIFAPMMNI